MPELEPCPFCGSESVATEGDWQPERLVYTVACDICEAVGPVSNLNKKEAIKLWNKRSKEVINDAT